MSVKKLYNSAENAKNFKNFAKNLKIHKNLVKNDVAFMFLQIFPFD